MDKQWRQTWWHGERCHTSQRISHSYLQSRRGWWSWSCGNAYSWEHCGMASHSVDTYGATHGLDLLCMWPGRVSFTLHEHFLLTFIHKCVPSIFFLSCRLWLKKTVLRSDQLKKRYCLTFDSCNSREFRRSWFWLFLKPRKWGKVEHQQLNWATCLAAMHALFIWHSDIQYFQTEISKVVRFSMAFQE